MEIVIILLLILLNGILSMSEMAVVSARKTRLESEAKAGSKTAKAALSLAAAPDRFLSTVQIGITLIGILTGLYSGEKLASDFAVVIGRINGLAPYALGLAKGIIVIAVTYLTLIFGELVPKRIGLGRAESVSKSVARPMRFLSWLTAPFVWLLAKSTALVVKLIGLDKHADNRITEDEIKAIVKEGRDTGEVQEVEHDIVERVFNLGDRTVDSIMTHRSDLVWLDVHDTPTVLMDKGCGDMHDVYPVSAGKPDEPIGVVYMKDLFGRIYADDFRLEGLVRQPNFLPENQSVYSALEEFKQTNSKYGLIINEFGEMQGIITLKDIMEALVGEVPEEGEEADMVRREDGSWLVTWEPIASSNLQHTTLEYVQGGETQTVIVENGTTETVLTGLAVGDELSVFSTFLPENAFETFDSPRETYSLE